MEGCALGIPSIALSQCYDEADRHAIDWSAGEAHGADVIRRLVEAGWPKDTLINVNFPGCAADEVKGVKVVPQGKYDLQSTEIEQRIDARQRAYYWIGLRRRKAVPPADSDLGAVYDNYIAVTPLHLNLTEHTALGTLRRGAAEIRTLLTFEVFNLSEGSGRRSFRAASGLKPSQLLPPMIRFETVSEAPMDRRIIFASLLLAASPLVAGCMPDDAAHPSGLGRQHHHAAITSRRRTAPKPMSMTTSAARPTARPRVRLCARSITPYAPVTSQPLAPIARADAPAFAWPVSGRVISDFGSTANGGKNDGINIATAMDAPIHASASGTVTYAGDELKNYGNLVLIKHADGFTTAYAHADRLVVSRGDVVTKGQVIGYAGQTGDVDDTAAAFRDPRADHAGQSADLSRIDDGE